MRKREDGRIEIHQSDLSMLAMCGVLFERVHVKGERRPPGVAALRGTATHKSVEANMRSKLEGGSLTADECAEIASAASEKAWEDEGGAWLTPEERSVGVATVRGDLKDSTVRLARLHYDDVAPALEPEVVEEKFLLDVKGASWMLAGTIDLVEGGRLRDLKTSGKTPAATAAVESVQLQNYALARTFGAGERPKSLHLDYLVDLKRGAKAVSLEAPTPTDWNPLLMRIEAAVKQIEAGAFIPADPGHWKCSEKWCGFYDDCPFGRRARVAVAMSGAETD